MRYTGNIIHWNDDKGYGFVFNEDSKKRIFVHIKAFNSNRVRPCNGDMISYEHSIDINGRDCAINIGINQGIASTGSKYRATSSKRDTQKHDSSYLGIIIIVIFVMYLLYLSRSLPFVVPFYIVFGLITYSMYGGDKDSAQNGEWRTSESTLLVFGLIGGWIGAFVAQRRLRHKNRKMDFQVKFWVSVIMNLVGLSVLNRALQ